MMYLNIWKSVPMVWRLGVTPAASNQVKLQCWNYLFCQMCRLKERKNLFTPLYFLLFCKLMRNIPFYSAVYLLCELWSVVLWGAPGYLWCHADWMGNQAIQIPEPRGVSCKLFLPRMDFNTRPTLPQIWYWGRWVQSSLWWVPPAHVVQCQLWESGEDME